MLFAQQNGLAAQVLGDSAEIDVLQNLACGIGPHVDGINAARSLPQTMGAFVTAGAQGACVGRNQQSEQHTPTTGYGFGADLAPTTGYGFGDLAPTRIALPTTFTSKLLAVRDATSIIGLKPVAIAERPPIPGQPDLTPAATTPATATPATSPTYPPGSITAFDAKKLQWRIAVPRQPAGFGFFDAASSPLVEVAPAPGNAPPVGVAQVPKNTLLKETGQLPFFKDPKNPLFWVAIAGGVAVIGGGSYFLLRKRKTP
jgi:hypothetical protein